MPGSEAAAPVTLEDVATLHTVSFMSLCIVLEARGLAPRAEVAGVIRAHLEADLPGAWRPIATALAEALERPATERPPFELHIFPGERN